MKIIFFFSFYFFLVNADESGSCSTNTNTLYDDCLWKFISLTGVLEITGKGPMNDYTENGSTRPWNSYRNDITSISIEGITRIGSYAFYQCNNITEIVVPETVTRIQAYSFANCNQLTKVTVGSSVSTISNYAFAQCSQLKRVELKRTSSTTCSNAFSGCTSLYYIITPDTFTSTTVCGFASVHQDSEGNPQIGGSCGNSETDCNWRFDGETAELIIKGNGKMKSYTSSTLIPWKDYKNYIKKVIIDGITTIGQYAFYQHQALQNVSISSTVYAIGINSFMSCTSLETIEIPSSVTTIDNYAFKSCTSLTTVIFPENLNVIQNEAFAGCTNLKTVLYKGKYNPQTCKTNSFKDCQLLEYVQVYIQYTTTGFCTIPTVVVDENGEPLKSGICGTTSTVCSWRYSENTNTLIITGTHLKDFTNENEVPWYKHRSTIKKIEISTLKKIGNYAFTKCVQLEELLLPQTLESIGNNAFEYCELIQTISIPKSVEYIGKRVFNGCKSLKEINVPLDNKHFVSENGILYSKQRTRIIRYPEGKEGNQYIVSDEVIVIDHSAFNGTKLSSIVLPQRVTTIYSYAFAYCTQLQTIVLPSTIEFIDAYAFSYSTGLTRVEYQGLLAPLTCHKNSFYNCPSLQKVSVPTNFDGYTFCSYTTDKNKEPVAATIEGKCGTTAKDCSFSYLKNNTLIIRGFGRMTPFEQPDENPWYWYLPKIRQITIDSGLQTISEYAFANLVYSSKVYIKGDMIEISDFAFFDCATITEFYYDGVNQPQCDSSAFSQTTVRKIYVHSKYKTDYFCDLRVEKPKRFPIYIVIIIIVVFVIIVASIALFVLIQMFQKKRALRNSSSAISMKTKSSSSSSSYEPDVPMFGN